MMTSQEFIRDMGLGWNLGNTYECAFKTFDRLQFKHSYSLSIVLKYGETTTTLIEKQIGYNQFSLSATVPSATPQDENISLILKLKNTNVVSTEDTPIVSLNSSLVLNGTQIDSSEITGDVTFPCLSNSISTYEFNTNRNDLSGTKINISGIIKSFPESTDASAKLRAANITPTFWGTPSTTTEMLDAVKSAGFKTIRIPITWKDHMDSTTYKVDKEWFDEIKKTIDYCVYTLKLYTIINVHHDDNEGMGGWLFSDTFITDEEMQLKYKTMWKDIATEFAGYPENLIFAGYNETRGSDHSWDTKVSENLYGIQKIGEAFYETVRAVRGNETRILVFPTYASKVYAISQSFKDSEGVSCSFSIPNDNYCAAEVHMYSGDLAGIRKDINKVVSKGIPAFIGEFGINASDMSDVKTISKQQYMVGYARYKGIGAILWDDYGGMGCLIRNKVNSNNYTSASVWRGNEIEFIPNLVKSSNLKIVPYTTEHRRTTAITGDKINLSLHSDYSAVFSIESGSSCGTILSDNLTFFAGSKGVASIVGIACNGDYNVFDITVNEPSKLKTDSYTINTENILKNKIFNQWNETNGLWGGTSNYYSLESLVKIQPSSTFVNTSNKQLFIVEYKSSTGGLIGLGYEIKNMKPGESRVLSPNTNYIGISIYAYQPEHADEYTLTYDIIDRDYDYNEYPTENREINLFDFSKYKFSIYRTTNVLGNVSYRLKLDRDDIYAKISELDNNDKELTSYRCNDCDSFTTQNFTSKLIIELYSDFSYVEFIEIFKNKTFNPRLEYVDYVDFPLLESDSERQHVPRYVEESELKDMVLEIIGDNSEDMGITITDEQIETAVDKYMDEHPIENNSVSIPSKTYKGAKGNNQAIITFIDDDGKLASYNIWTKLHASHGVVADLGIPLSSVGSNGNMTWTQLDELNQLGFNIISHGYYHTNYNTISKDIRRYSCEKQVINEVNTLRNHGYWHEDGNNIIALPNNYTDENTTKAYRKYYDFIVGESSTVYSTPLPFKIGRKFMDSNGVKLSVLKTLIDKCYENGGWLIISFHGWEHNNDTKIGYITETIEYIQSLKIPIMTSYQALQIKGNIVDSGIYDNDGTFHSRLTISKDGNTINNLYKDDSAIIECTDVSFDVIELTFDTLDSKKVIMTKTPFNTTGNVYWASSNKNVATVDENGIVTPVSDGEAIIYGACAYPYAQCKVRVQLKCTDINISKDNFTFNSTEHQQIAVTISPQGCNQQVVYTTSDDNIATVSNTGMIRPVNDGTCTLYVTCGDITKTATLTVTGLSNLEYVLPDYNLETYKYYTIIKDENSTSDIKYMFIVSKKDLTKKWTQSVSGVSATRYSNSAVFDAQKYTSTDGKVWIKVFNNAVNPNYGLFASEFTESQYTVDTNCSYTE